MHHEFCTLFDVNYLPRALVLHESLRAVCGEGFRLRAFCMDDESEYALDALALPEVTVIGLAELEAHDAELLAIKSTRTPVEYFWTATPSVCLFCLEREPEVEQITYLDADLRFFSNPRPLFAELGDASVLIVPHRYAPEFEAAERFGIYNVQFMTFRRTPDGLKVLHWWHDRCVEWCYNRVVDGKFGDQKYLDDWPERFPGVHVLEHLGGGLAPWNAPQYELRASDVAGILVDGQPLVFYHHHGLKLIRGTLLRALVRVRAAPWYYRLFPGEPLVWRTSNDVPELERRLLWEPYIERLAAALRETRRLVPSFRQHVDELPAGEILRRAARRARTAARRFSRSHAESSKSPDVD